MCAMHAQEQLEYRYTKKKSTQRMRSACTLASNDFYFYMMHSMSDPPTHHMTCADHGQAMHGLCCMLCECDTLTIWRRRRRRRWDKGIGGEQPRRVPNQTAVERPVSPAGGDLSNPNSNPTGEVTV